MLHLCRPDFPSLRATYDLKNYHHMYLLHIYPSNTTSRHNHLGTLRICPNDVCQLLEMFFELPLVGFSLVAILRDV